MASYNDKRPQILNAAKELFSKKGYHGTTLPDIAKAANISVGLIYYNFKNKEDILVEILSEGLKAEEQLLKAAASELTDPLEKFDYIVQRLYTAMDENAKWILIQFKDVSSVNKETRQKIFALGREEIGNIAGIIRTGQESGRFSPDINPELFAANVVGIGHLWALKKTWLYSGWLTIDEYISEQLQNFHILLLAGKDAEANIGNGVAEQM